VGATLDAELGRAPSAPVCGLWPHGPGASAALASFVVADQLGIRGKGRSWLGLGQRRGRRQVRLQSPNEPGQSAPEGAEVAPQAAMTPWGYISSSIPL